MKKLLLIAFTLLITSSSAFAGEGYGLAEAAVMEEADCGLSLH